MKFTIGIVTYIERFDKWFKPLLTKIKDQRPDVEVIVCVNGEHNKDFDEEYRKEMLVFLSKFSNVYPMFFTSHRSLSKLWNNLLINSTNDILVRLDDDLTITNTNFITLTISADVTTTMNFSTAVYDLEIIDPISTAVTRLLQGKIKLSKEVTTST